MMWENCLRHLHTIASVSMSFIWRGHGNLLMKLLSLQSKSSDRLPPPYLCIVKVENFHPILTPSLKGDMAQNVSEGEI